VSNHLPQTADKLYFFIEVPQGNDLSIVVGPKGLHIDQPKVEIKYGHGVMGQASSFDDLPSGKTEDDAGKTGGTSLTSSKYPDVCPLPASRFGADAIRFFAGRQESERARSFMRHGRCLHTEAGEQSPAFFKSVSKKRMVY
jgi:hypothetical protein